jgi:hypothetical protein
MQSFYFLPQPLFVRFIAPPSFRSRHSAHGTLICSRVQDPLNCYHEEQQT